MIQATGRPHRAHPFTFLSGWLVARHHLTLARLTGAHRTSHRREPCGCRFATVELYGHLDACKGDN